MPAATPDYLSLLTTLKTHDVDFIVVGGVCAVLHGAPIATFDLDVVHSRSAANVDRLMKALDSLKAYSRSHSDRRVEPDRSHLDSPGHLLLMTEFGPLDLLGSVGSGHGYEELMPHTSEMTLGEGLSVRLLDLETLIRLKEETAHEKDLAVLPLLRRTLAERDRS